MIKLIYLGADWCGPCKKMKPIVEEFEKENPEVLVVRVDVDQDADMVKELKISSVPTLIAMKDNKEFARKRGATTKQGLENLVFGGISD